MITTSLPLRLAMLCEDCNEISVTADRCPICESRALLSLAKILNREPKISLVEALQFPTPQNIRHLLGMTKE